MASGGRVRCSTVKCGTVHYAIVCCGTMHPVDHRQSTATASRQTYCNHVRSTNQQAWSTTPKSTCSFTCRAGVCSIAPQSLHGPGKQRYRCLRTNHYSKEECPLEDRLSEHHIRGWNAVSAAGLLGQGSGKGVFVLLTPVGWGRVGQGGPRWGSQGRRENSISRNSGRAS